MSPLVHGSENDVIVTIWLYYYAMLVHRRFYDSSILLAPPCVELASSPGFLFLLSVSPPTDERKREPELEDEASIEYN